MPSKPLLPLFLSIALLNHYYQVKVGCYHRCLPATLSLTPPSLDLLILSGYLPPSLQHLNIFLNNVLIEFHGMIRIFNQLWFGFRSRRKIWMHCSPRASAITRCHLRRGTSEPRHSRTPRRWAWFPGKQNSDRHQLAQDWKVQSRNRDDRFDASVSFLSNFNFQKIFFSTHVFKL